MEKKQSDLCREVLRRLDAVGVLDGLILIGSWCLLLYRDYFRRVVYRPAIRTRDLDLLIPLPPRFTAKVDLQALLDDLGFVINFKGDAGWITFSIPTSFLSSWCPNAAGCRKTGADCRVGHQCAVLAFPRFPGFGRDPH